jgi:oxalate---CoA ligase
VRAHSLAVRNYIPQPYDGHVTVFRAASQVLFSSHFRDLGWSRLAASVSVHHVPGSHATLIAEPHVRELARQIGACLPESQPADTLADTLADAPDSSTADMVAEADEIAR